MKRQIILAGVALACVSLSACSTTTSQQLLTNLQSCQRHYDGAISGGLTGGQFSGTIKVDCPAKGDTTAPATTTAPGADPALKPGGT